MSQNRKPNEQKSLRTHLESQISAGNLKPAVTKRPGFLHLGALKPCTQWRGDGVDHIRIADDAKVELGVTLTPHYKLKFVHDVFGTFKSISQLWNQLDYFVGERAITVAEANAQFILADALWQRVKQYPEHGKALLESTLPFDLYDWNDVNIPHRRNIWWLEAIHGIRTALRENRSYPNFSSLLKREQTRDEVLTAFVNTYLPNRRGAVLAREEEAGAIKVKKDGPSLSQRLRLTQPQVANTGSLGVSLSMSFKPAATAEQVVAPALAPTTDAASLQALSEATRQRTEKQAKKETDKLARELHVYMFKEAYAKFEVLLESVLVKDVGLREACINDKGLSSPPVVKFLQEAEQLFHDLAIQNKMDVGVAKDHRAERIIQGDSGQLVARVQVTKDGLVFVNVTVNPILTDAPVEERKTPKPLDTNAYRVAHTEVVEALTAKPWLATDMAERQNQYVKEVGSLIDHLLEALQAQIAEVNGGDEDLVFSVHFTPANTKKVLEFVCRLHKEGYCSMTVWLSDAGVNTGAIYQKANSGDLPVILGGVLQVTEEAPAVEEQAVAAEEQEQIVGVYITAETEKVAGELRLNDEGLMYVDQIKALVDALNSDTLAMAAASKGDIETLNFPCGTSTLSIGFEEGAWVSYGVTNPNEVPEGAELGEVEPGAESTIG